VADEGVCECRAPAGRPRFINGARIDNLGMVAERRKPSGSVTTANRPEGLRPAATTYRNNQDP
jgi:hypothetical protein